MELLTGYLWEVSGEWERQDEETGSPLSQSQEKFLIYKDGAEPAWYCLTETEHTPDLDWGDCKPVVPAKTTIGQDLAVLDADGHAGYTVWIAKADGATNECTVLIGD